MKVINAALFLSVLFALFLFNVFIPRHQTISEIENRALKTKPTFTVEFLFSGDYFREYEDYYADHFVFREAFVRMNGLITALHTAGRKEHVNIVTNRGENIGDGHGADDTAAEPPAAAVGKVLVLNDAAMNIFTHNDASAAYYYETVNRIREKLPDGITVYSMLVPTHIEFLTNERYRYLSTPQMETIDFVYRSLKDNITRIDAYQTIKKHSDQYLYFRSDHHWTALGAYYAYTAFIEALGDHPVPLSEYAVEKVEGFLGTTYSATLDTEVEKNPDTVYLYKPFVEHSYIVHYQNPVEIDILDMSHAAQKNKYGIFISGDRPLGKITTAVKNSKKLVVIKDSYGNAFIPFLLPHYEEIYIIDPRQFTGDLLQLIQDNDIPEVLFLNNTGATTNNNFTTLMDEMLKRIDASSN